MKRLTAVCCASLSCQAGWYPLGIEVVPGESGDAEGVLVTDLGGLTACREFQHSAIGLYDLQGAEVWTADSAEDPLWGPHNASMAPSGLHVAVSDTCNDRVLVFGYPSGDVAWDSAVDCPELDLLYPNAVYFEGDTLQDGLLVTVLGQHVVVSIDPAACGNGIAGDEIRWQYGVWGVPRGDLDYTTPGYLSAPHNAYRVRANRHVVIADSGVILAGHSRVLEVDDQGRIVWSYHPDSDCGAEPCPGLVWTRDVDLLCDDEACGTATALISDNEQTVGIRRDLTAPGAASDRRWLVRHPAGLAYDADWLPTWEGDDNAGEGWLMVSHHGFVSTGSWVRVVPADSASSEDATWQL
jgi:hypothetical protein